MFMKEDDKMIKIPVGISNRHIHLSSEDIELLFGEKYILNKKRDLSQKGQYACEETVALKIGKKIIKDVRVLGPARKYTQVELLKSDADFLEINPPVRDSGDLDDASDIIIVNGDKEIMRKNVCIIASRHIHANTEDLKNYKTNDIVSVKTKDGIIINDVHIKKDDSYVLEFHIDKEEAEKFNIKTSDFVILD